MQLVTNTVGLVKKRPNKDREPTLSYNLILTVCGPHTHYCYDLILSSVVLWIQSLIFMLNPLHMMRL